MPSPTYSQNKASIMRYRAKNANKLAPLQRGYSKLSMRRIRAYRAAVKQLLFILVNFFED